MTFKELNITEPILKAIEEKGYAVPTPIQGEAIPAALAKRDILGCAQTGTGKTASFAIPIIQHLQMNKEAAKCPARSCISIGLDLSRFLVCISVITVTL